MPARTRLGHRAVTRALTATLASLALAAAAGCGGEPETNIEPADDKPKRSEEAKDDKPSPEPTFEVADEPYVQVALDYYEGVNEANRTGDAERLRELSTKECETCRKSADSLEAVFENGGSNEGGEITRDPNVPIEAVLTPSGKSAEVVIVYKYAPQTIVRKAGAKPEKYPAERMEKTFTLQKEGERWLIAGLVINDDYEG